MCVSECDSEVASAGKNLLPSESSMEINAEEESLSGHPQIALIKYFCEITSCPTKSEALLFLESHNFDLDAAVSTFLEVSGSPADTAVPVPNSPLRSQSQNSPSDEDWAPSRFRSPSPPRAGAYNLRSSANPNSSASASRRRSRRPGGRVTTLGDLNGIQNNEDSDSDLDFDPQGYYTGGEKSGMLVQDPTRENTADAIIEQARQSGAVHGNAEHLFPPSSSSTGTERLLPGEVSSTTQVPESVVHNIVFWRNGFSVDGGPLRCLDDPENASFLESIKRAECPKELAPADGESNILANLVMKDEDYQEPKKHRLPFQGLGRTLRNSSDLVTPKEANVITSAITLAPTRTPAPLLTPVVDETQPSTSIQLRLADGTRLIARFNYFHTVQDVRGFIDSSRSDGSRTYQLQVMGFPPKLLTDLDQTIDQAGIANSVVIQKQ